ncbi:MAG: CvpA family protein [Ginsengibacter sp.]
MIIDVAFFFLMVMAIFKGFTKGFVVGLFSLVAFIIGIAAALKLSAIVAHYLENSTGVSAKWLPVLSFMIVFIIVVLLVNLGAKIIKKTISLAMLGWLDRIGGILLYAILYIIIFSIVLFFFEKTFLLSPATVSASTVHGFVSPWGPKVIDNLGKILPVFKDLFIELQLFFEKIGNKVAV